MRSRVILTLVAMMMLISAGVSVCASEYLETLQPGQNVHGFTALNVYENGSGKAMGARFISSRYGFLVDVMEIQSVPQAFYWIKTVPTSSMGEPHACEHLLLGKGNRGRYVAALEDMSLGTSSAATAQLRTCYHFNTIAAVDNFYEIFEAKLQAFLHPDFTDEEIRREVCHIGVTEDPETGLLMIDEKGTVYTEMVSAFEKPWYHTFGALNQVVYGDNHPLTNVSGGDPDIMRDMTAEDMRVFHGASHQLENMGAIVSIPDEISVEDCLARLDGILSRCQEQPGENPHVGIGAYDLPSANPAPVGTTQLITYPSERADDQGYLLYAWPADLELNADEEFMLSLFLETFAGGPTTNLYDLFLNSDTRQLDIGGNYVYAGFDDDLGVSIYFALVGVDQAQVTETMLDSVINMALAEVRRMAALDAGSKKLVSFNDKARARLVQARKQYDDYLNSPPMFGARSGAAWRWLGILEDIEEDEGFRKSLVQQDRFDRADSLLALDKNIWTDYLDQWRLLTVEPYQVGATPDPTMITAKAEAKKSRIYDYLAAFKEKYGTDDDQEAIRKYQEEFDANTAELEATSANQALPKFIANPPLTLDDQLNYEVTSLVGDIPLVASTFENMTSSTLGMALRLDVIPEPFLVYVPFLTSALTDIGVTKDGQLVPYEEMDQRLREEIMRLGASFDVSYQTERVELVLSGQAANQDELQTLVGWMEAALFEPYLDTANLPRIKDIIDQELAYSRNRVKGSEESWVQYPSAGYRFQTNPLIMTTNCFLTQTHQLLRLKWLFTDPGDETTRQEMTDLLEILEQFGQQKSRDEMIRILTGLETVDEDSDSLLSTLSPPAATLSEPAKELIAEIAKEIKTTLSDIPDANLAEDWAYLMRQTKSDLLTPPSAALHGVKTALSMIRKADNARLYMISNSSDEASVRDRLDSFVGRLESAQPSVRQNYAATKRVDERLRDREPEVADPTYVGLVFEGTNNGVLMFSTQYVEPYDTSEAAIIDCLAGKLYSGGGGHGLFMRTWAAGLAYSNGYSFRQGSGRTAYYAERCPDVAEAMGFVVDALKSAEDDPSLVEYAVAQVFGGSRADDRYESRGRAMASDLADGTTSESVQAFRQKVLQIGSNDNLYDRLKARMEAAYGSVLVGYGPESSQAEGGNFFLIGPEPQFESLERYIAANETPQPVYRLYPRDFWLVR